ncbi:hypothetical protein BLNAU_4769 [Blattamonas nauphoetae]|uniref:Uncharacterized protein n=1 Tax=Blattamonas nauphoetae TaxID=2049346 RepID=A0ABQ9Y938_9EUKA|nr:hypothetical protein BLNAU_4769 [Blattamonas nauphoetae]
MTVLGHCSEIPSASPLTTLGVVRAGHRSFEATSHLHLHFFVLSDSVPNFSLSRTVSPLVTLGMTISHQAKRLKRIKS